MGDKNASRREGKSARQGGTDSVELLDVVDMFLRKELLGRRVCGASAWARYKGHFRLCNTAPFRQHSLAADVS